MSFAGFRDDFHDAKSVPALWAAARWLLRRVVEICGAPCALVAEGFLSRRERREIGKWLCPLEAIVRRLLVVEAARLCETSPPVKAQPRTRGARPGPKYPFCRVSFPDPENSSRWTVRFALSGPRLRPSAPAFFPRLRVLDLDGHANILAPAALRRAAEAHRERMQRRLEEIPAPVPVRRRRRPRAGNPWPLAKRIEAVSRVLDTPGPYARRLARRLRTHADRLAETCRPPPPTPPGRWPPPCETPLYYASKHAIAALDAFEPG